LVAFLQEFGVWPILQTEFFQIVLSIDPGTSEVRHVSRCVMPAAADPNAHLPNFLIIGAAKAGTTYLAARLSRHPQAFVVQAPKEPSYFSYNYKKGLDWYRSLYRDAGDALAIGESSPHLTTTLDRRVCKRIEQTLSDPKLIYIVRHPMRRIQSHWMEDQQSGQIPGVPFNESLRAYPYLVESSLYWQHLTNFLEIVPENRILVLLNEDLVRDSAGVLRRCMEFLGIDPEIELPQLDRRENVKSDLRQVTPLLALVRQIARKLLGDHLTDRIPRRWKVAINKSLGRTIPEPIFDSETYREVAERVRPDADRILEYLGRSAETWQYDLQEELSAR
jgi:hypothetical protein